MSSEKKKPSTGEAAPKSSLSKSMKKSKSRIKITKPDASKVNSNGQTPTSSTTTSMPSTPETPTTPTSSMDSSKEKTYHRGYAAFSPRTVKIIWEQHDTSDTDIAQDLLPILAEDVSYKVWELAKNLKTYSTHSGGFVSSDLVNEVLKDSDCPPVLGSMNTDWDRIDYDGSFFFNSDKIIELRSEYQKDVQITMPMEPSLRSAWPIQGGCRDLIQSYMQSIFLITLGGNEQEFDSVRQYVYSTPFMGGCYRVLLLKIIQTLAFKQTNHVKIRCWRLMQTLVQHTSCRNISCREELFHLAEIFVCQLMDTYEATPVAVKDEVIHDEEAAKGSGEVMELDESEAVLEPSVEIKSEDVKPKVEEKPIDVEEEAKAEGTPTMKQEFASMEGEAIESAEPVYRLEKDNEDGENVADQMEGVEFSSYAADKVDANMVDVLCETIGLIGAANEFFNTECMHLILRRLEKFFTKRHVFLASDYDVISRAIRGLFALGEYAFREFIPFMEKMNVMDAPDLPDSLRLEFACCAIFLRGHDDIFLYEWLEEVCSYRLLPFMTYYAHYHQKLIKKRYQKRRAATFKVMPKVSAKRVLLPVKKTLKKEQPTIEEVFPDREIPVKPPATIRFKFAGCRQIPVKKKPNKSPPSAPDAGGDSKPTDAARDVIIARRKLFKPLTDERKFVHLSNYHLLRIK